ncbi:MAG TPA: (2Fe-2S)-binding protein [Caldimonas sp.]|jgi:bacterioferritin-associated ferredoxin
MIVCVCRRISDQAIRKAAAAGAVSLECLQIDLGVATQCGRCADCAVRVLDEARGVGLPVVAPLVRTDRVARAS